MYVIGQDLEVLSFVRNEINVTMEVCAVPETEISWCLGFSLTPCLLSLSIRADEGENEKRAMARRSSNQFDGRKVDLQRFSLFSNV